MTETLKLNGNWQAVFIGANAKIRRELTPLLAPRFGAFSGYEVAGYPSLNELGNSLRGIDPNLCFIDVSSDKEAALALVGDLLRLIPTLPVIAVLANNDPDLIIRCLRQGTTEFLLAPFTEDQIEAAIQKLAKLKPSAASGGSDRGRVFCVMPAKGGSGATTVACNLAYQWKKSTGKRVFLADLDPLAGTMSFLLKMKSGYSFMDVLHRSSEIDSDLWKALTTNRNGVDVLLSPEAVVAGMNDLADAGPVIEYARSIYDIVIVDAGSAYGEWNLSQAHLADEVLLVATNELTALQAVQRSLMYLDSNNVGRFKIRIVVNRYDKQAGLSREVIGTALQADVFHVMPSDYDAVQRALLDGKPVVAGTGLGKSIAALAEMLVPISERKAEAPAKKGSSPFGGLLSLFSRTSG